MTDLVLVSVAIPLYRSAPHVDNIAANIDRITRPSVEILISDRHGADDAIDRLEGRYAADARVRFLRSRDEVGWVTHYNDLLGAARGRFFCWMPHDDVYAPGYVEGLAAALDADPTLLLAFGAMHAENDESVVPVGPFTPPPIVSGERWSLGVALRLLLFWDLFRVVRGLCRRDEVLKRKLFLPTTRGAVFADVCWAFSVAVAGPIVFVDGVSCTKRYHAASASAQWRYGARQALEECAVMSGVLWRSSHPRVKVLGACAVLAYVAILRTLWRILRPLIGQAGRLGPRRLRARFVRWVARAVAPRRA